jgi:hypothetical protein
MAEVKITNKLLREAIADAEMLVKTAQENAKISLEESFTPQIKSMLARRLRAEAEGMDDEEEDEKDVETQEAPEGEEKEAPKAAPFTAKAAPTAQKMETAKELPHQDGEPVGSSDMPADTSAIGSGDNKEPSDDSFASAEDDMSGEGETGGETEWYEDWTDGDFDLDEVIKELEDEMNMVDGEESEEEETADEAYPDEDPEAGAKKPEIPADSSDIGTAEGAEVEEKPAVAPTAAPVAPKMGNGEEGGQEAGMEAGEEEELDLEQILRELEADDQMKQQSSEKMASLETELAQYRTAVKMMREKLHEVNLLNAKLLYTNKIFRKEGLSTDQKVMVVENFDRASTVREVKMVYTVLVETLTSAAKVVKATKAPSKVVAEGLASKATPSTAPKTPSARVIEENSVAKRLQLLAGII